MTLAGKVAIVTGAGRGTGSAAATALADAGVWVCVADQNPDRAQTVADSIVAGGGRAFAWQIDVANKFQVAAMIEETRDRFGRLDILVHNAHVQPHGDILKMDEWDWRRTVEVNLTGAFYCGQLAARVMADEGGGVIVYLARRNEIEHGTAFAATQGGVVSFAEHMAKEVEPMGVRVSAVMVYPPEHETVARILEACEARED